jgi:hypothetical protein
LSSRDGKKVRAFVVWMKERVFVFTRILYSICPSNLYSSVVPASRLIRLLGSSFSTSRPECELIN